MFFRILAGRKTLGAADYQYDFARSDICGLAKQGHPCRITLLENKLVCFRPSIVEMSIFINTSLKAPHPTTLTKTQARALKAKINDFDICLKSRCNTLGSS